MIISRPLVKNPVRVYRGRSSSAQRAREPGHYNQHTSNLFHTKTCRESHGAGSTRSLHSVRQTISRVTHYLTQKSNDSSCVNKTIFS